MAPERGVPIDLEKAQRMANEAWQRARREDPLAAIIFDGIDLVRRIRSDLKEVFRSGGGGQKDA